MEVKDSGELTITGEEITSQPRGTMESFTLSKLKEAGAPISGLTNLSLMKDIENFNWHHRYDKVLDADVITWERK